MAAQLLLLKGLPSSQVLNLKGGISGWKSEKKFHLIPARSPLKSQSMEEIQQQIEKVIGKDNLSRIPGWGRLTKEELQKLIPGEIYNLMTKGKQAPSSEVQKILSEWLHLVR